MKAFITILVLGLLIPIWGSAQNYEKVLQKTNVNWLREFAEEEANENSQREILINEWCNLNDFPRKRTLPDGRILEIVDIDQNGMPRFRTSRNDDAATTISTDKIQNGGLPNFNLSGRGIFAGIWDGGAALATHQELVGRISVKDGSSPNSHATHVAGTMIAAGFSPQARGMASEGALDSYYWDNDKDSMAAAALKGLLVSNHSYGFSGGWIWDGTDWYWLGDTSIDSLEDFRFGRYDTWSKDYDNISFNAPYYTLVWAAGNQKGGTGPFPGGGTYFRYDFSTQTWVTDTAYRKPNGPYDNIVSEGCAKNTIVVGGVDAIPGGYVDSSSAILYAGSSSGPMDDGRIKPDITANAIGVFSCTNASNSSYGSWNGTSMAAPGVSGTIMLLQEHYSNLNEGNLLRSESVHALVIHSANEAGSYQGPDYEYGWGLMNGHGAAEVISRDSITSIIDERVINQGNVHSFQVYADGNEALKATIVWHEPGSDTLPFALNDTTPMLINDLDLRILSSTDTSLPWTLDLRNPSHPATKGDNRVDNVEQVVIPNPVAGTYTVQVSHKGSLLNGNQTYSVIVTGINTGDTLFNCRPVVKFNSQYGQFTDGSGAANYKNDQDCAWLIQVHQGPIELSFDSFDLESNSDFVRIYDGVDNTAPLLNSFTGSSTPAPVFSTGSSMYVEFSSDNTGTSKGFLASWNSACYAWQAPNAGFNALVWPTDTCQRRVVFTNTSSRYDSVTWDYGDGNSSSNASPQHDHFYSNGGIYNVTLIAFGNQCTGNPVDTLSMDVHVGCLLGVEDDLALSNLNLYPNPVREELKIEGIEFLKKGKAVLMDVNGREIQAQELTGRTERIDVSQLEPGIYLLQISSGDRSLVKRIIKI